jgi:putative spermidine/putrescine transport system ATP-binding protein
MTPEGVRPAAATTTLELDSVSKSFGATPALREVCFRLERGEFLTLLGPSGSGKTTTLRVIAGFLKPDRGAVRLHGSDVSALPPYRRNIGMVFQDYALFPHMTVAANVGFPLEARGIRGQRRKAMVKNMLAMVGLESLGHRFPRQLSGGQQQRVALARALVFNPEIVLLDEPLGALDKKLRGAMQLEILRVVKSLRATVISVTHDQEEALVMSDRIAIFSAGSLVQIGSPRQLYERPETEFVADFIGEANLLRGQILADGAHCAIIAECWQAELPRSFAEFHNISSGSPVVLAVRPENIAVRPLFGEGGSAPTRPNTCRAVVRDKIYLGVEFRLVAALPNGASIQVRNRSLKEMDGFVPGSTIELSWNPEDAVVLRG